MKKVKLLSLLYLLSLVLLVLSGSLNGAWSETVYILSFALPTAIGLYLVRREESGERKLPFSLDLRAAKLLLPTVAPIVLLIILASVLTSLVIGLIFGAQGSVSLGDSLPLAILTHALMPAVFEEALYRYLPMRLWGRDRGAQLVVVSSLFFALVHRDFFVIPYAFLAGALFMIMNIITDSIWPSVILHAINNTLSVVWIFYSHDSRFALAFYISLVILSAISLIFIYKRRGVYLAGVKKIFDGEKIRLDGEILYLAIPTLALAAMDLLSKI